MGTRSIEDQLKHPGKRLETDGRLVYTYDQRLLRGAGVVWVMRNCCWEAVDKDRLYVFGKTADEYFPSDALLYER